MMVYHMQYLPIRIDSIIPDVTLGFNVYMQVGSKHLLYFKGEDAIEDFRLKTLLDKEVKVLYIDVSDAQRYKDFLQDLIAKKNAASSNSSVSDDSADAAIDGMYKGPRDAVNFKNIVQAVQGVIQVLARRPDSLGDYMQMFKEEGSNNPAYLHANRVCATTVAFAALSGIKGDKLLNLGCAAMLLEIGVISLHNDDKSIVFKKLEDMSKEELDLYKTIPQKSYNLLDGLSHVPDKVLEYIIMHEERKTGLGFPNGEKKIPMENEIINMCACFDRKTTFYGMSVAEAVQSMKIDELGNFDLNMINKFAGLLKSQKTALSY